MQRRQVLSALTAAASSALLPASFATGQTASTQAPTPTALPKERVTGIGGFFFRAQDPKSLAQWYQDHLGIFLTPQTATDPVWEQQAGPTSFTPMSQKTKYIGDPTKQWMLNLRVADLDKMAAQLQAANIAVKVDPTAYPYGRFAHLQDPEGNSIELWQPMTPPPAK